MANRDRTETLTPAKRLRVEAEGVRVAEEQEEVEERKIQELEREVTEMAEKIIDFRSTVPQQLADVLSPALLASRRPNVPEVRLLASQPSAAESSAHAMTEKQQLKSPDDSSLTEADERMHENLNTIREKALSNMSAAPHVLKRVNECIERINKVGRFNVEIHSVFKRKR